MVFVTLKNWWPSWLLLASYKPKIRRGLIRVGEQYKLMDSPIYIFPFLLNVLIGKEEFERLFFIPFWKTMPQFTNYRSGLFAGFTKTEIGNNCAIIAIANNPFLSLHPEYIIAGLLP